MNIGRLRINAAAAAVCVALTADACNRGNGQQLPRAVPPMDVRVAAAAMRPWTQTFEAGGVVAARMTAHISPRIVAELREVRARPGDRVRKGQILAVLDDRDLALERARANASAAAAASGVSTAAVERESADARLVLARANHGRIEQLHERRSATPQEMDRATSELSLAEAGVRAAGSRAAEASSTLAAAQASADAANVAASFSTITAPFDGLVTNRHLEPGNMASPGRPLLTVETTDGFRLEVQVDAARAASLRVGDAATVVFDAMEEGDTVVARVAEIARAVDPAGHAFVVKVELPSRTDVRSGMFARARFETGTRDALVVPASAVVRRGQLAIAFVVDGNRRARMRSISVGAEVRSEWVEVLAGIRSGEMVIVNPPASLIDGAEVRIAGGRL
jgi:RND family efflux transporter MFP subunit